MTNLTKKNNSKYILKRTLILALLLLSITALFSACTKQESTDRVTSIHIMSNPVIQLLPAITITSDDSAFSSISPLINQYNELPQVVHDMAYDISLDSTMESGQANHYDLDLDLVNHTIYITDGVTIRFASSDLSLDFYMNERFQELLTIPLNLPETKVTYNDAIIDTNYNSNLYYPSFNHTTIESPNESIQDSVSHNYIPIDIAMTNTMKIDFDEIPDSITQTITDLDTELTFTQLVDPNDLIIPTEEGNYEITVSCLWNEDNPSQYYGHVNYVFYMALESDPIISITSENTTPGEIVVVRADYLNDDESIMIHSDFDDVAGIKLENGHAFGIIPTPCYATPDSYVLTVDLLKDDVVISQTELPYDIYEKEFPVALLYVTQSTASIMTNDNAAKDQVYFDQARANPVQTPLFDGPFIQPVEGRITTEYGVIRVTNDDYSNTRRHYGIDIANELGTEVAATNRGLVTLSMELIVTGNTIVIDHGMGLFSLYFHLDELLVDQGSIVEKGDIIAKMGSTGYSTGSHLHFGIWYDGVYLNPWSFFENDYITSYIDY